MLDVFCECSNGHCQKLGRDDHRPVSPVVEPVLPKKVKRVSPQELLQGEDVGGDAHIRSVGPPAAKKFKASSGASQSVKFDVHKICSSLHIYNCDCSYNVGC